MAKLTSGEAKFNNLDREEIKKDSVEITFSAEAAEKGGYEHFMMKEIYEQPDVVKATINLVVKDGKIDLSSAGLSDEDIRTINIITIVAYVSVCM